MEFKDYYQTLGVERSAAEGEIKRAYRKLARKYHPDVSKERDADERMKAINEAYEVLKDPEKRAAYDRLGSGWRPGQDFRPPPDWDAGFEFRGSPAGAEFGADFSDFFTTLFGAPGARRGASFHLRGEDHHARVLIDIEDAFLGAKRAVTLRVPNLDAGGRLTVRERMLNVHIPKGIRAGQIIRLAGQGTAGQEGGSSAGDLYIEVGFKPHPLYRVDGRDLCVSLPVAPWEAALGATVKAPTPAGTVEVKVPAHSQGGRKLRLKGRGIPGDVAGDLYLVLELVLPSAETEHAKQAYRNMAQALAFDPRRGLGV